MRPQVHRAVVALAVEAGHLQQVGARGEVAGGGGLVAKPEGLAADVLQVLHRATGLGDEHRLVGGRAAFHADGEGLDAGGPRLGQHVRERAEVRHLDATEAHGLDHRRVVGGDDELDFLVERLLQVALQRLRVLDQAGGVLVGQQGHPQAGRVACLCMGDEGQRSRACNQRGLQDEAMELAAGGHGVSSKGGGWASAGGIRGGRVRGPGQAARAMSGAGVVAGAGRAGPPVARATRRPP